MMQQEQHNRPHWVLPRGNINEAAFCAYFQIRHPMIYTDGAFFSPEGRVSDEGELRRLIYEELRPYVVSGLAAKTDACLNALRIECRDTLELDESDKLLGVPVANGTYWLHRGFSNFKNVTRYRLPVAYDPEAPEPVTWLRFLKELLYEEDIPTLQEYMGYCLIPTTAGQKMLMITGRGGEGKSRIGVVMKALLGENMNIGSIAKLEASPFARADLEHLLVLVDDDLKMEALNQTNYIKSIITAELPMDLERKGIQSYQGQLNCRLMAFGNGSLQALHDRSHGFFRRQIILTARERDPNRKDDPYLGYALKQEAPGILLWCIEGLKRLQVQDFQFTISPRARENMRTAVLQGNNVLEFLRSQGYIRLDSDGTATSKALYEVYRDWCADNALSALSATSFWTQLAQNASQFRLTPSKAIPAGNGRFVRGFRGIRICSRF